MGAGLGGGNDGVAAGMFGAFDVWPWMHWGFGLEGSLGGSAGFALSGPSQNSSLLAARMRFGARFVRANGSYFSAAIAAGIAKQVNEHHTGSTCSSFENDCSTYVEPVPSGDGDSRRVVASPTAAFELAFQGPVAGPVELGLVVRGEVASEAGFVTFGPVLGARF